LYATPLKSSYTYTNWPLITGLFLIVCLCVANPLSAQQVIPVQKTKWISQADSSVFLDYWIVNNSLQVYLEENNEEISQQGNWKLVTRTGWWHNLSDEWMNDADSVQVRFSYKRHPFTIRPVYFIREAEQYTQSVSDSLLQENDQIIRRRATREDIFGSSNLQRSGSLTRGITVGNNQDLSLQSGLRFELSGFITDDIEVLATLTDQSTPIQPDGSTQNLRELDKVYMRLRNSFGTLQLGDIDVDLRSSEFAQIGRRLQGIDFETDFGEAGRYSTSASVVRGRFRVQEFTGRNGVQGPYRLSGAEGEQFIIVLAGTERVYLNGVRVNRGEENDYVIDYSLGEINFTSNKMITDVSRITVDFQYVTQEYSRTLITAEGENRLLMNGRLQVGATIIRESDSKDLNAEFGLSDEEIEILRQAGIDPELATISGAEMVGFQEDADFILYVKKDTTFAGQQVEIFENIPGDTRGVWRVRFSRVGENNGSYKRKRTSVNGIVYEWVGPGNGEYEPFRRIPAPQSQQMAAIRARYQLADHLQIFGEWAGSDFNRNRFSAIDNENNTDMGYLSGIRLNPTQTILGKIDLEVRHRFTGRNFAYFDRTREVEFERRWNVSRAESNREQLTEGELGLAFSDFSSLQLQSGLLDRTDIKSYRQQLRIGSNEPELPQIDYQLEYINSALKTSETESIWFRQTGDTRYSVPLLGTTITPNFRLESEKRRQQFAGSDSLQNGSFSFYDITPGVLFRLGSILEAGTSISYRKDRRAFEGQLLDESESISREFTTTVSPSDFFRTKNSLILRDKIFSDVFIQNTQAENNKSIIVRSETDYSSRSEFLDFNIFYEGGTESRPLLQETFIEVGPETGNYVWIDENDDGVQQIDEFFPAQTPNEGTFVLQFVPSDELFPVVSVRTRARMHIQPEKVMGENDDWFSVVLSNIELTSSLDIREQNRSGNLTDILLLNIGTYQDAENTIDGRIFWQQDIRLFRPNRNLDARFTIDRGKGLRRRAVGLDESLIENIRAEGSYRFLKRWIATVELKSGTNNLISEELSSRSFQIESVGIKPSIRYEYNRSLQIGTGFSINRREDTLPELPARLNSYTIFTDVNWFYRNKIQSFARVEYRSNQLRGVSSSFGAFELTDGAGRGNTWLWSVQATYRINEYLRASLNYDGRTITERPSIQTLRFSMNAIF